MNDEVTDIWFRSKLTLMEIGSQLGLEDLTYDTEYDSEWVIGDLSPLELGIARTRTRPAEKVYTRIYQFGLPRFSDATVTEIVGRLGRFVSGSIFCGRWQYCSGEDRRAVVKRFESAE